MIKRKASRWWCTLVAAVVGFPVAVEGSPAAGHSARSATAGVSGVNVWTGPLLVRTETVDKNETITISGANLTTAAQRCTLELLDENGVVLQRVRRTVEAGHTTSMSMSVPRSATSAAGRGTCPLMEEEGIFYLSLQRNVGDDVLSGIVGGHSGVPAPPAIQSLNCRSATVSANQTITVGIMNVDAAPATYTVDLLAADGTIVDTRSIVVDPINRDTVYFTGNTAVGFLVTASTPGQFLMTSEVLDSAGASQLAFTLEDCIVTS